ncbi:transposase [Velocimicrobium porci]|uniref:Transposase IS801/IS1294 domain-containing protein n=1 Tax=Velocimicrobium porci TaxID=2606634 RepID=A0A6L5Y1H8_9FIRM|nr:hypothetical protein [Velocimicrobium porci]
MPKKCNSNLGIKYIGRYLDKPVIATSRINFCNEDFVIFHYNGHKDNKLITETITALDFISCLIQHISEKHFKMILYYRIYSRYKKSYQYLRKSISKKSLSFISFNCW